MNKANKRTFLSKPDEMEMAISYQAMRITWAAINIIFIILAVIYFINGGFNPVGITALVLAEIIYFIVKSTLSWNMTRGGEDKK